MRTETLEMTLENGTVAWQISEFDTFPMEIVSEDGTITYSEPVEQMTSRYMVYTNPNPQPIDIHALLQTQTPEQIAAIKQFLLGT
jgi:hypothetical protein